jgi:hypothetical protein
MRTRSRGHANRSLLILAVVLMSVCSMACTSVAAYERGKLAHPTMRATDGGSVARDHVYAIQEGAMGGTLGAASGCGCN